MVSSRQWPLISRYRASVRTQSPKVEMIDSLFKRVSETDDEGMIRWNGAYNLFSDYKMPCSRDCQSCNFDLGTFCRMPFWCVFLFSTFSRELLLDFYTSSGKRKPDQIIIFRYIFLLHLQWMSQLNALFSFKVDICFFLSVKVCKITEKSWGETNMKE